MTRLLTRAGAALCLCAGLALFAAGCTGGDPGKGKTAAKKDGDKGEAAAHSGWWCDEHGIPEAECSMCSAKVAKECKAKGDWCKEHNRAESQCFICHPELREKFAAQYRAKYGKEPPPTEDDEKAKKGDPKDGKAGDKK